MLDAVEQDAEPSEQPVVLADVRRQLAVEGLDGLRQAEILDLKLAAQRLRAVVKAQDAIVASRKPAAAVWSAVSISVAYTAGDVRRRHVKSDIAGRSTIMSMRCKKPSSNISPASRRITSGWMPPSRLTDRFGIRPTPRPTRFSA